MEDLASLGFRINTDGLRRATGDLDRLDRQSQTTTSTVQKLGAAFGALGIGAALQGSLASFANFERGLIGVGKTTDISGKALADLGESIRELSRDLPVTSAELLSIAQGAGQVGVEGAENILRFTETVGKLGLASDLAGEQAAVALTRILTTTGTAISEVDRLGSTIVQLGNNFAATESEIAEVATRVALSTSRFNVSAAEVLGISTALKAVGVQAESGGTQIGLSFQAINDAIRSGGEELARLERITGRTGDALREDFFNGQSAKVFEDFVTGLGNIQKSGGDVSAALSSLGLNGSQANEVLSTLATRADVLSDALSQANTEYEDNVALNKEAAVASTSFSAQLQLAGNAADEAASAIGSIIAPAALEGLSAFRDASIAVAENIDTVADAAAVLAIVFGARVSSGLLIAAQAQLVYTSQVVRGSSLALAAEAQIALALKTTAIAASQRSAAALVIAQSENAASVAVLNSVRSEVQLESVRLRSQMTAQARAATVSRLNSARLVLANATRALSASEVVLAEATTVAAAAEARATVTTTAHAAALARTTVTARAAALAMRGLRASVAFFGGPVGILLIATGSAYYFRDAIFNTRAELGAADEAVRGFTDGLEKMTAATVDMNRQSLAQQMRENTIAIAEADAELDRLQEKQKLHYGSNPGRMSAAARARVREAQQEVAVLTRLAGVMGEQFEKLNERANQLATTATAEAAEAAAIAAAIAAGKVTAALIVELKYLRLQNGLVEAGISASKVEIAIMETKRELMLESKGLTAEQAVEMVALEKAIKAGIEAQREEDQMLQNLRDQYGDTTKAAQDFTDQVKLLSDLLLATGDPEYARMLKRLSDDFNDAGEDAAEAFKNPWEGVAQDVARSLQDAIASGDWDSLGEGIGNAFAASMSAVVSKSVSDSLSEGLTKDSAAISQISAAFAGPIAGAVVGGLVQLAVSKLGDFFSGSDFDPTEDRQDAQGAGTVLGSIDAKSDSIAKATEITASTNEELVNINTGMLQALKSVNAGILGASAMIARAQGNVNFQTQNEFSQQQQAGQAATALTGGTIGGLFGAGAGLVLGTAAGLATLGAVGAIVGFGVGALIAPIALLLDDLLGGIVSSAVGFLDNLTGGLLSSIGSSVFGGDQKIVDEGIRIVGGQITDLIDNVLVQSFAEIKTDGGFFSSDDYDTEFAALPDEIRNQFSLVFEGIVDSVSAGAAAIGLLPADIQSALNQFRVESQLISLEGLNAGEQTAAIQEVFGTIFDNLATSVVPFLDDFQRAGEGLGETLARVATQVQLTEEAALSLGLALNTSVGPEQIARISGSLVDLVGGVEAFASAITSFESNFFSESEQFDVNARRLTQALGDLPLADTRQGFVDLLQAQDVTTASGREAVATLLRLQGSADDYYSYLEDASEAAAQLALDALNGIKGATDSALGDLQRLVNDRKSVLQEGYNAEVALIQEQTDVRLQANQLVLDAAKAGVQALQQELTGITSAANRLRENFEPAQSGIRSGALATLRNAINSGDLTGTGQAADVASDINAGTYTNSAEYRAEQARTLFTLSMLQDDGESQLTVAERTVNRLSEQTAAIRQESERQIQTAEEALNRELEALDLMYQTELSQLNELRGIKEGLSGGLDAIAAALRTLGGALSVERIASEGGNPEQLQGVAGLFQELLGRPIGQTGAEYFAGDLAAGQSLADIRNSIMQSPEYLARVPGFADGGMHSGGLRIVGERGPELEATGSSKIMSNSELMSSLGGNQKLASEMKSMHSDMMQGLNVIAKNTNKGSRQLERWDLTGLPAAREFV